MARGDTSTGVPSPFAEHPAEGWSNSVPSGSPDITVSGAYPSTLASPIDTDSCQDVRRPSQAISRSDVQYLLSNPPSAIDSQSSPVISQAPFARDHRFEEIAHDGTTRRKPARINTEAISFAPDGGM